MRNARDTNGCILHRKTVQEVAVQCSCLTLITVYVLMRKVSFIYPLLV